ncbi:MAG: GTP 3',8-cyclase MoaA [Saprospiraceae bacterium]|nr:GTP 3',8-cyclase MoaA [Saprospiraceae bacterium]
MVQQLIDNHGRPIHYLRLAVTDRCNLRCFYCMPAEGIDYVPKGDLMSYEEMHRLVRLGMEMGINKVRITGGEPFVRKDMIEFLEELGAMSGLSLNLTTNGTLTHHYIDRLEKLGIASVNLSLDTLDRQRFHEITRRDELPQVMETLEALLERNIRVKINAVVMKDKNIDDLVPLALLSEKHPLEMRFIEEMPFNGEGAHYPVLEWNHLRILDHLSNHLPNLEKVPDGPNATAKKFQVQGFKGTIGIIAAFSRTFCGTCDRIRVTPVGQLKTCLYDDGVFNVKNIMRAGATDEQVKTSIADAVQHRAKNGFEAEQNRRFHQPVQESMSTIGG